jgi:hypothetical protein
LRDYILTPGEKRIIKEYLENGNKLEGFYVLVNRIRKHDPKTIASEEDLIRQFLAKVESKQP